MKIGPSQPDKPFESIFCMSSALSYLGYARLLLSFFPSLQVLTFWNENEPRIKDTSESHLDSLITIPLPPTSPSSSHMCCSPRTRCQPPLMKQQQRVDKGAHTGRFFMLILWEENGKCWWAQACVLGGDVYASWLILARFYLFIRVRVHVTHVDEWGWAAVQHLGEQQQHLSRGGNNYKQEAIVLLTSICISATLTATINFNFCHGTRWTQHLVHLHASITSNTTLFSNSRSGCPISCPPHHFFFSSKGMSPSGEFRRITHSSYERNWFCTVN